MPRGKEDNMKKLLLTMIVIFGTVAAMVAQTSFQVIPPRNVIAGNVFYVTYRLTNGDGSSLNAPAISGCKLLSPRPGVSTMQSKVFICRDTREIGSESTDDKSRLCHCVM